MNYPTDFQKLEKLRKLFVDKRVTFTSDEMGGIHLDGFCVDIRKSLNQGEFEIEFQNDFRMLIFVEEITATSASARITTGDTRMIKFEVINEVINSEYTHVTKAYICPICLAISGIENEHTMIRQEDIFYRGDGVLALINSKWFVSAPGHVIVVPKVHVENIYQMGDPLLSEIAILTREVAVALKKVRLCGGVKIIQNNEPVAGQHAFHFHTHVVPMFAHTTSVGEEASFVSDPNDRAQYSQRLREYFSQKKI